MDDKPSFDFDQAIPYFKEVAYNGIVIIESHKIEDIKKNDKKFEDLLDFVYFKSEKLVVESENIINKAEKLIIVRELISAFNFINVVLIKNRDCIVKYFDSFRFDVLVNAIKLRINDLNALNPELQLSLKKQPSTTNSLKWHSLIPYIVNGSINKIQESANKELTATEISQRLIKKFKIPLETKDVKPYIQYTFIEKPNDNPKNLFSRKKVISIFKFCQEFGIPITDDLFNDKVKKYVN